MRYLRGSWGIGIAAALLSLSLAACDGRETEIPPAVKAEGPRLALKQVKTTDWKDVSAQVSTVDEAQVLARIPGVLTSLTVREGDMVRKGQTIGRIVDSQLGPQAAAMRAQAVQAKAEFDRVKFLYDNGVYAKARLEQAQAASDAAQAQLGAVNAIAGQGAVVAPASGRVITADIPAGAPVAPGMVIAAITAGPTILRLELPESLAASVHPGSRVIAQLPGGEVFGTIAKVYPAVRGGQVRADAAVAGLENAQIGRRISAKVAAGEREALLVPSDYVTTSYGIDTVWAVAKDGSAASVPVQTAPSAEAGMIEILSGLSAGDVLVKKAAK